MFSGSRSIRVLKGHSKCVAKQIHNELADVGTNGGNDRANEDDEHVNFRYVSKTVQGMAIQMFYSKCKSKT